MLSTLLWIVASVSVLSVVLNLAMTAAKKKPWEIALTVLYSAFAVTVIVLAALSVR